MMQLKLPIFSVSEVSNFIKTSLEDALPLIKIIGEVSNFTHHIASGHLYFSLKDGSSLIKAVCFKQNASKINFKIEDGMKLTVTGKISAFVKSSHYQIIITEAERSGIGELAKIFEELKIKLAKEGLFDKSHKKPIPFLPKKIGLITSKGGAVLHDILKTLEARFPSKIAIYQSLMQGLNSSNSVISGIQYFNKTKDVDVIIIARGGGSMEDLFEFNNEKLIRTAFKSKIPIISAIGHETDFTLLDFVADKRAATPTGSVIIAVPDIEEVKFKLTNLHFNIKHNALNLIEAKLNKLENTKIIFFKLQTLITSKSNYILHLIHKIKLASLTQITTKEKFLEETIKQISFFDINQILKKGFGVITKKGYKITSIQEIARGDILDITLQDGSFKAIVSEETLL